MTATDVETQSVTVDRESLFAVMKPAARTTASGLANPALVLVRVVLDKDGLWVESSDGISGYRGLVPTLAAEGAFDFQVGKRVANALQALPDGEVELAVSQGSMKVSSDRGASFTLPTYGHQWPTIDFGEKVDWKERPSIDASDVSGELAKALGYASKNPQRPHLGGVNIAVDAEAKDFIVSSTDTFRLYKSRVQEFGDLFGEESITLPGTFVSEFTKLFDGKAKLAANDRLIFARDDQTRFMTRRVDGKFPNIAGLIPEQFDFEYSLDRNEAIEAIERVKVVMEGAKPLALEFDGLDCTLKMDTAHGQAIDRLDAAAAGEDTALRIGFNADYLMDGLKAFDGDEVKLQAVNATRPVLLSSSGEEQIYLLIPVRLP